MKWHWLIASLGCLTLTSCTFNPFSENNDLTGSPTGAAIGAGIGAGATALLKAPKPMILIAGLTGGMIGYYGTTLRYSSGGIIQAGGQVYTQGAYVGIDVPTDQLFEPNTAEFLPQAKPALDSIVAVLQRYPNHNIFISANTSGFGSSKYEHRLSEQRAKELANYLWANGINSFKNQSIQTRSLNYAGYGNDFPISSPETLSGLRANSRIQITAYPSKSDLGFNKKGKAFNNVGGVEE